MQRAWGQQHGRERAASALPPRGQLLPGLRAGGGQLAQTLDARPLGSPRPHSRSRARVPVPRFWGSPASALCAPRGPGWASPRPSPSHAAGTPRGVRDPRRGSPLTGHGRCCGGRGRRGRAGAAPGPPPPPAPGGRAGPQGARPLSLSFLPAGPAPAQSSPAQPGSAHLGSAHLGSARHTSARHGTPRHGTPRLGTPRHGSARFGSAMPRFSVAEARQWGDQFVQFLQDTGREEESRRDTLRSIYNLEFRGR